MSKDDFKIMIENVEGDGSWILSPQQNVPAIIRWICPVCGYENARDFSFETLSSPPLNSDFIISLLCDNEGCSYMRAVALKINMTLSLEGVLPQTVEEFEALEKKYKLDKPSNSARQFLKQKRDITHSFIRRV